MAPALEQLSQLLIDEGTLAGSHRAADAGGGDSSSPDIYDLLGDAYSQAKDYANAETGLPQGGRGDPDDPGHRHGLAQALMCAG